MAESEPIFFAEYTFYLETGELQRQINQDEIEQIRLAPQPAQLLGLLIENYPEILSQEAIKTVLWPNTSLGYEGSLHYCVRQVRVALNDEAQTPKFIETIPKRGYRWMIAPVKQNLSKPVFPKRKLLLWIGVLSLGIITGFLSWFLSNQIGQKMPPQRVALMPFQSKDTSHFYANNDIAWQLLNRLSNTFPESLELIGPTTTIKYGQQDLRQLLEDYHIDWIINGKFTERAGKTGLLAEVIRAEDGAHVWVRYFDSPIPIDTIVLQIESGFVEALQ